MPTIFFKVKRTTAKTNKAIIKIRSKRKPNFAWGTISISLASSAACDGKNKNNSLDNLDAEKSI